MILLIAFTIDTVLVTATDISLIGSLVMVATEDTIAVNTCK
jgi:hypothetical protein